MRLFDRFFKKPAKKEPEIRPAPAPIGPVMKNGRHTHEYYSHAKGMWRCPICGRCRTNGKTPPKHKGCFGGALLRERSEV